MKATVWVSFVVLQPLIYWLVTASVGLTIWFIFLGGGALFAIIATTRRAVWRRDKGKCACCGTVCPRKGTPKWHMDHIQPLIEAQGNLDFWRLTNLRTLCSECHKKKTGAEATARAAARRAAKTDVS